jgi:hypothetical protein
MPPLLAAGTGGKLPSAPIGIVLTGIVLVLISIPIARRVTKTDGDKRLFSLLMICFFLHMLGGPAQILVDNHVYHGVSDFTGYVHQGATLSTDFRAFHFTTSGAHLRSVLGDGSVSIAAGIVFSLVGVNEVAAFFVFAWFSWLGTIFFYKAYALTFPEGGRRRYALMLFLLPSLLFWTSDVSKEAIMMLALGVATLGAARVLARVKRGYPLVLLGIAMGVATRPNEFALLLGAFTVAMVFRRSDRQRAGRAVRRVGTLIFLAIILSVTAVLTLKFVHSNAGSIGGVLHTANQNNSGKGVGFGSSNVPYSSDPLLYPRDIYTVLFDPLPITAGSLTQVIAAGENTVILVLVLTSLRRLRLVFRVGRERPYVILCAVYSAAFIYSFAALGNLGLITRERTLLFPFLLVLLAVPLTPKGEPPQFAWEQPRLSRRQRRLESVRAGQFPTARRDQPVSP